MKGRNPSTLAHGAMATAKQAVKFAEYAQGIAQETYKGFQEMRAYVGRMEDALSRMTEANAVAYRLLFSRNDITMEDRKYASAELDSIKELFALLGLVSTVRDTDSPLLMFEEVVHNLHLSEKPEGAKDSYAILIEFKHPEDPPNEDTPAVTLSLSYEGESQLIDGYPGEDMEVDATLTVHPELFENILKRKASIEVAFMDGKIMVDHPFGLIRFEEMYDVRAYIEDFEAKEKMAAEAPPEGEPPLEEAAEDRMELKSSDVATEGHPEGAIMFGGDYVQGPE